MQFTAAHAQGAEKHPEGRPFAYGFAGSASTASEIRLLNIGVSGPALAQGMTYSLDDKGAIRLLTINNTGAMTGEMDWRAAPGGKMTADSVKPGVISGYRSVTFGLHDVVMAPTPNLGAGNKATGTFKMSGECNGAVTDYQGP